ncbi:MAG: hypothetical protein WKF59_12925 [Chitinophagaceae bacterium]
MKKNKSLGTNGSVNLGYSIGTYPKYNTGFSLNHRNKNINVFGNYNYNNSRNERYYRFYIGSSLIHCLIRRQYHDNDRNSQNFKAGMDYFINKKSTVGVMINGNIGENTFSNDSQNSNFLYTNSTIS